MSDAGEPGMYRPLNYVSVQDGHGDGYCWVAIPASEQDHLGIEKGDTLVPVSQDGMLVYIPVPDGVMPDGEEVL